MIDKEICPLCSVNVDIIRQQAERIVELENAMRQAIRELLSHRSATGEALFGFVEKHDKSEGMPSATEIYNSRGKLPVPGPLDCDEMEDE